MQHQKVKYYIIAVLKVNVVYIEENWEVLKNVADNINWRDVQGKNVVNNLDMSLGTMTKWPVQKPTHRTTQKHVEHHDATDI